MAGTVELNSSSSAPKPLLPALRQELKLYPAESDLDGAPTWVLHDPLTNRHFRLGSLEIDLLMLCGQGDAEKIAQLAALKIGHDVKAEQVEALFEFLRKNNLVSADAIQKHWYQRQAEMLTQQPVLKQIVRSYLSFRIPLWRPNRFLEQTLHYVSWLGSPAVLLLLSLLLVVGVFLTLRQFDSFIATFLHFFNASGFAVYFLALAFVKILHELGHAYTAKQMGCNVPTIGVAFLVGWPVLYTDTSDAWKLTSRSKRLKIGVAGIAVEFAVAIICLFSWNLVDDGVLRSMLFLLATSTWIVSLLVNFNPLMRFDGYYLLSDWWRVPNLESRATAMAKWWLRERLFGLSALPPEPVKVKLLVYAYSLWTYRFFLFLGIALVVYYYFFKALGIVLFGIEIVYFIIRPIFNEIRAWQQLGSQMRWNKATQRTTLLLLCVLGLGFIPWRSSITAAAFVKARYTPVYTPVSGRISRIEVNNGDSVEKGMPLIEIDAPELRYEKEQEQRRYQELSWQRAFLGFDEKLRAEALIVSSALLTQNQKLRSLLKKQDKLILTAPDNGIVADFTQEIKVGDWLAEGTQVLATLDAKDLTVIAFVEEEYLARIKTGIQGRFYPERGNFAAFEVEVIEIEKMAMKTLDSLYNASLFGGDVAVRENKNKELIPVTGIYKIRLKLLEKPAIFQRVMRGSVVLKAEPQSFFSRTKNRIYTAFRKEAGF